MQCLTLDKVYGPGYVPDGQIRYVPDGRIGRSCCDINKWRIVGNDTWYQLERHCLPVRTFRIVNTERHKKNADILQGVKTSWVTFLYLILLFVK